MKVLLKIANIKFEKPGGCCFVHNIWSENSKWTMRIRAIVLIFVGCALSKGTQGRRSLGGGKSSSRHAHRAIYRGEATSAQRSAFFIVHKGAAWRGSGTTSTLVFPRQVFQRPVVKEVGLTWLGFGKGCLTASGGKDSSEGWHPFPSKLGTLPWFQVAK